MAYHKSLKKGESLTLSGAATVTAVSTCKLSIEAEDDVVIDGLDWKQIFIEDHEAFFSANGKNGQSYMVKDDLAMWHSSSVLACKLYEGDRPKEACEAHNKVWSGEC